MPVMLRGLSVVFLSVIGGASAKSKQDVPCLWKSLTGAEFDLRSLKKQTSDVSYYIKDGDIPCTPEIEPSFSYLWNFCGEVTPKSYPRVCDSARQQGASLQYIDRSDGFQACFVIGHYDQYRDDLLYSLLDPSDPSKGVSMRYPDGDKCPSGNMRSTTLDVMCDNIDLAVVSALEPVECAYHIVMRSYRGCPTTCPVTSKGLCNSHGHCAFDSVTKKSYCYCNKGYGGDRCDPVEEASSYDGYSVQLGLLIVLVIVTVGLIGVTVVMIQRITAYRKEQVDDYYSLAGSHEMASHHGDVTF